MSEAKRNKYALKTVYDELIENGYIDEKIFLKYIELVYLRTKVLTKKSENGMADYKNVLDSHLITRRDHMEQAAWIANIITHRLNLNEIFAEGGMLGHDIGHAPYSHEGEVFLNLAGILLNAGYYHHNAKGVDDALTEDFIDKFVEAGLKSISDKEKRKEIADNPEIIKTMKDDAWYFLEFIVGHDGEATRKDSGHSGDIISHRSIKEAVLYNTRKANSYNNYKAQVSTLEAVVAKASDVIAYLKTDVENSFRKKIVTKFSDNYLEQAGALLFEDDEKRLSRDERIKLAKEYLKKLKIKRLSEKPTDFSDVNKRRLIDEAIQIQDTVSQNLADSGIFETNIENSKRAKNKKNELINNEIAKYLKLREEQGISQDEIYSESIRLKHYINKFDENNIRKVVVEEFAENLQQALLDDYCENTKKAFERIKKEAEEEELQTGKKPDDDVIKAKMMSSMNFSDRVQEIIYGEKGQKMLNYIEYVQYSKKEFQTKAVPKAAFKAIKDFSKSLIKTGIIKSKFNNPGVLAYIKDEEVKDAIYLNTNFKHGMKRVNTGKQNEKESQYRSKIGINEFRKISGYRKFVNKVRYVEKGKKLKTLGTIIATRNEISRWIYESVQRREETFALFCEDVYYAIPNTVKDIVDKALDKNYKPGKCLKEEEIQKVKEIKKELKEIFKKNNGNLSEEDIKKYIRDKVNYERTINFDQNVANALVIKYIGGFTDKGIEALLLNTGYLSKIKLNMQDKPTKEASESVKRVLQVNGYSENNEENNFKRNIGEIIKKLKKMRIKKSNDENEDFELRL